MNTFPYKRIVVVGTTSSGKSTLAKALSERLNLDFIELDALYWEPNWKGADPVTFSGNGWKSCSCRCVGRRGKLQPRARSHLEPRRSRHLAGLSPAHRVLASADSHHPPRLDAGGTVERQPRKILVASQTVVAGVIVQLAVQNLLEKEAGNTHTGIAIRSFDVDPFKASQRNGRMAEQLIGRVFNPR
jgi:energy-coupling factor transporter ATP-binding protein EcfA2